MQAIDTCFKGWVESGSPFRDMAGRCGGASLKALLR